MKNHPHACAAAVAAKLRLSSLTLCDPIDSSPLGSSIPGILQARVLEWGALATLDQLVTFFSTLEMSPGEEPGPREPLDQWFLTYSYTELSRTTC